MCVYVCVQQDNLEMKQYTPSDGRHEEEPKDFEIGVHIKHLTKIYSKVCTIYEVYYLTVFP